MKFVAFFVLFVVAASKPVPFDPELNENWNEFKKAFGKNYNLSEEISRRSIWEKRVKYITQHNLRHDLGLTSYRMGLNENSDMEHEEFVRTFIGNSIQPRQSVDGPIWVPPANVVTPDQLDWREAGLVTPVKYQAGCFASWAFAATGALEGMHAMHTGRLVSFSEQNLIDCSRSLGCSAEGRAQDGFEWVIRNGGINVDAMYQYTGVKGVCRYVPWLAGTKATSYFNLRRGNEEDLKKAVALMGPIAVSIDYTHESLVNFKDGIYDNPNCYRGPNHPVLLVGYGTENGKDYWLVKNSWGPWYGVDGYYKMSRNKNNQCNITDDSSFPVSDTLDF